MPVRIVLPSRCARGISAPWILERLCALADNAFPESALPISPPTAFTPAWPVLSLDRQRRHRGPQLFERRGQLWEPLLLLAPPFLLSDTAVAPHLYSLINGDRPVFYEDMASDTIFAIGFPRRYPIESAQQWIEHLAGGPRPPYPSDARIVREQPSSKSGDAPALTARSLGNVQQLLIELAELPVTPSAPQTFRVALARIRGKSQVPWLCNSLLNHLEQSLGAERLLSAPREIHLATTGVCDIECVFCSYTHRKARAGYLKPEAFEKLGIYDWLEDLRLSSGLGEPTLNPNLPDILHGLADNHPHLCLNMFSNAVSWSRPGMLEGLSRLSWINTSLNASTAATWEKLCLRDRFGAVLDNIAKLRALGGPRIHGSMVLNSDNVRELPDLPALCRNYGINRLTVIPFFALGYDSVGKYNGSKTLEACRSEYDDLHAQAVLAAQEAGVSIELPPPTHTRSIGYGLETRSFYDFAGMQRPSVSLEPLLFRNAEERPSTCVSLWKLAAVSAASKVNENDNASHYIYPCLGPLASYDFSHDNPVHFTSRGDFFRAWNSPAYQTLRRGQRVKGLSHTCDVCKDHDSRDPANFALFETKEEELVQIR